MDSTRTEDAAARAEDLALVERMLAGDESAFDAFVDDYVPALYRFASSRLHNDRELVPDIVQTTLCKAISKLDGYRGEARLATWLCAVCRNEIAMHFRRQSSRPEEVELLEEISVRTSGPSAPIDVAAPERRLRRKEERDLVHRALDQLPPHYAKALEWKYLQDLSVKQIAWRLRVSPKAAESVLTRARIAFEKHYSQMTTKRTSPAPAAHFAAESVDAP